MPRTREPVRPSFLRGDEELPVLEEGHIRALEELFPPRCIGKGQTPEEAHRYAGKVELVQSLRARRNPGMVEG